MKTFSLKGKVTPDCSGVTFINQQIIARDLFGKGGHDVDVTLIFGKVQRSLAQNRYLWGVVYPLIQRELLETTGERFTSEELHAYNLQKIQGVKIEFKTIQGQEVMVIQDKKSSEMNTEEFSHMVDKLIQYCSETWGIVIPPPRGDNSLDNLLNL